MTNYEYYKKEIEEIILEGQEIALKDDIPSICRKTVCSECGFSETPSLNCYKERKAWLNAEHQEIDWSKVEVDSPILVKNFDNEDWAVRHFAKYKNGTIYAFIDGKTSWTTDNISCWVHARLPEVQQ